MLYQPRRGGGRTAPTKSVVLRSIRWIGRAIRMTKLVNKLRQKFRYETHTINLGAHPQIASVRFNVPFDLNVI